MKFKNWLLHEYRRYVEDLGLTLSDVQSMILRSLQANPDNKEAGDTPLVSWDTPNGLISRFNSLNSLSRLISANPAAMQAIQSSDQTKLTVGQLAGILLQTPESQ